VETLRPVRCLVVCSDSALAGEVEVAVGRAHGATTAGTVDPVPALAGLRPGCDVMLVADLSTVRALGIARELAATGTETPVLLLASEPSGPVLRDAMAVGARGVLGLPPDPEQLELTARAVAWPGRHGGAEHHPGGRVIAVCGAKGGVGATLISVALALAADAMLVDLAQGADIASHLGCVAERSIADLARLGHSLTAEAVGAVAVPSALGVRVLPGVASPELAALLPTGLAPALARECRAAAPWTMTDVGTAIGSAPTEALVCADAVVVVTTPDRLAVAATSRLVTRVVGLGVSDQAVGIVVNRWTNAAELRPKEVERAAGARVLGVVREDSRFGADFANDARIRGRRRGAWADVVRIRERLAA
jgi:pilus assembly protein CpaE